jgi:hypothetical protein
MATIEARVRKHLDPEEPNYSAAAAELGAEALPVLEALVQVADPLLASKAAYLASLIPDAQADRVIERAARSEHPTVRVAAAAGMRSRPETTVDMAAELMADPDAGVRKVATKTTRGRATAATRRESPEEPSHDRDRSGQRPAAALKRVQVLEGEHGGGFPPGGDDEAARAEGQGGGDTGNTRDRSAIEMAGTDAESGGGGDVGGGGATGVTRSGDGPDGGGQLDGAARGTGDSQYGGGGV